MNKELKWISVLLVGFVFMHLTLRGILGGFGDLSIITMEVFNILGFILVLISSTAILINAFK